MPRLIRKPTERDERRIRSGYAAGRKQGQEDMAGIISGLERRVRELEEMVARQRADLDYLKYNKVTGYKTQPAVSTVTTNKFYIKDTSSRDSIRPGNSATYFTVFWDGEKWVQNEHNYSEYCP